MNHKKRKKYDNDFFEIIEDNVPFYDDLRDEKSYLVCKKNNFKNIIDTHKVKDIDQFNEIIMDAIHRTNKIVFHTISLLNFIFYIYLIIIHITHIYVILILKLMYNLLEML